MWDGNERGGMKNHLAAGQGPGNDEGVGDIAGHFAMRQWSECQVYWVMPQPIDYPDMWLSVEAWHTVSSRFSHFKRLRQQWPKPDLVSVCTSSGFIDESLSQRLVERIKWKKIGR